MTSTLWAVLTRHQRTLDVPRPLVRGVPDVLLEAVLLLAGAAPGVELHGHTADAGGEHHLVVPDSCRFVRMLRFHPGVVGRGKIRF